jgi:hypothetical protein
VSALILAKVVAEPFPGLATEIMGHPKLGDFGYMLTN